MIVIETTELNVVTGAFGYTGRYITQWLLSMGERVRTLTEHPDRENPLGYLTPSEFARRYYERIRVTEVKQPVEKVICSPETGPSIV